MSQDQQRAPGDCFTEQGIRVYQISDYEWYAGADLEAAIGAALKDWGMTREEAFGEGIDKHDYPDESPEDLDANKVNVSEDEDPKGPFMTYREHLRYEIERGVEFPCFFAGVDI